MAFILAVNPGNSQSPTLARLARELPGCELIGADTFEIATTALAQREPDLVLLPEASLAGEAAFLARLGELPRGISAMRLPQASDVDFDELTTQIKALLDEQAGGHGQRTAGASAHLIAAARATVRWIRSQRGRTPNAIAPPPVPGPATSAGRPAIEPILPSPAQSGQWQPASLQLQPLPLPRPAPPPQWPAPPHPPPADTAEATDMDERPASASHWPKVAAAALIALVAAGVYYWPEAGSEEGTAPVGSSAPEQVAPAAPSVAPASRSRGAPPAAAATTKPAPDAESRVPGWIAVFAPFEIAVSEGNSAISLDESGRAMLPPGPHTLRFRNQALSYDEVRTVEVRSTETTSMSLTPDTTLSVTSNEPAEVLVDGTSVGQTPLKGHRIPFGTHIVIVKTGDGQRELTVEATAKPVQLDLFFSKP